MVSWCTMTMGGGGGGVVWVRLRTMGCGERVYVCMA